jgi:hypothetical protein
VTSERDVLIDEWARRAVAVAAGGVNYLGRICATAREAIKLYRETERAPTDSWEKDRLGDLTLLAAIEVLRAVLGLKPEWAEEAPLEDEGRAR